MESLLIKLGIVLKWLLPASIGSGIAVLINKEKTTNLHKFLVFVFGLCISVFVGGGIVEYFDIQMKAVQATIYFGLGLWGIGILMQINEQMPQIFRALFSKFFGVDIKDKSE